MTPTKRDKNTQVFRRVDLIKHNNGVLESIRKINAAYDFLEPHELLTFYTAYSTKELLDEKILESAKERQKLLKRINGKIRAKFLNDVQGIVNKHQFGQEWFNVFLDILISGFFCPPNNNVFITVEEKRGRKTILLEAGPETTKEDIAEAYKVIANLQKKLYPAYSRHNYSKAFDKNIWLHMRAQTLLNQQPKTKGQALITKLYPDDESSEFTPKEKDIRRSNALRQTRRRMKL